ncbi:MAG: GNAT family N-acetyltransferase [Candidatus Acidiferrales bacterium]
MPDATASIRTAKREDADFLAWAILVATRSHLAKGYFDIVLNRPENEVLDFIRCLTLTHERSFWHYSYFLVAQAKGKSVAALSVFRAGQAFPLYWDAIKEAAHMLDWNDPERDPMWNRGGYIQTCILPLDKDPDVWAIENVATLAEYRRRGIAPQLVERGVAEAKSSGARRVQVTFMIGNDAAERAYAKAGFRFKDEKRSRDFEAASGSPGLRRYTRDLGETLTIR